MKTFNTPEFPVLVAKNRCSGAILVKSFRENFPDIVEISKGYQPRMAYFQLVSSNPSTDTQFARNFPEIHLCIGNSHKNRSFIL
jgi:hypothetical protein